MNSLAESSFDPLDYYKKLTNCLANRKNLKLNLSKIPGANKLKHNSHAPFLTDRKIQERFLEKCKIKRQQKENQKEVLKDNDNNNSSEALFKVKQNEQDLDNFKRKKQNESYINLPDSYFKSRIDLSIFKVPAVPALPPSKKQKIDINNPIKPNSTNFTLASIFTEDFNPQKYSTPIDKLPIVYENPQPIIADPNEFYSELMQQEQNEQMKEAENQEKEEKLFKTFEQSIDDAAKYIDSVCFEEEDPLDTILKDLNKIFEEATQSPRESLVSIPTAKTQESVTDKIDTDLWPKPIFFNQPNEKNEIYPFDDALDDKSVEGFAQLQQSNSLFSFLNDNDDDDFSRRADDLKSKEPHLPQSTPANSLFFDTPNIWKPSPGTFFNTSFDVALSPFPYGELKKKNNNRDDLEWLGEKFDKQMDMSWDYDYTITDEKSYKHDKDQSYISPLFRSSPKTDRLQTKHNFSRTLVSEFDKQMDMTWNTNFTLDEDKPYKRCTDKSYISPIFRSPPKTTDLDIEDLFSRTISRPKKLFNEQYDEEFFNKDDDFSWSKNFNDTVTTPFMQNETTDIFNTKYSLF